MHLRCNLPRTVSNGKNVAIATTLPYKKTSTDSRGSRKSVYFQRCFVNHVYVNTYSSPRYCVDQCLVRKNASAVSSAAHFCSQIVEIRETWKQFEAQITEVASLYDLV